MAKKWDGGVMSAKASQRWRNGVAWWAACQAKNGVATAGISISILFFFFLLCIVAHGGFRGYEIIVAISLFRTSADQRRRQHRVFLSSAVCTMRHFSSPHA